MSNGDTYLERAAIEGRDAGLRAIQDNSDALTAEAADRLDHLVREDDVRSLGGRYLAAVGNPAYLSAWSKLLADPVMGHAQLDDEEREALRDVGAITAERALSAFGSSGQDGGYAVPLTLDPSIMLTSDGAINPIRRLARVVTITGSSEWKGVTSAGVVAAFAAEGTETSDNSPTFGQPTITPARAQCLVPYSIELGQDWAGLQQELARCFADAKDVLEAQKFLDGGGVNEPAGVLGTAGLGTAYRVVTSGTAAVVIGDHYSLAEAIPARYRPRTSIAAHPVQLDKCYRLVGGGSTEPPVMASRDGAWLGHPAFEWSAMTSAQTSASKVAVAGDFDAGYTVVDRLGMVVELIPHLMGTARNLPTGQRALYMLWRTSGGVVNPNALRYLETK